MEPDLLSVEAVSFKQEALNLLINFTERVENTNATDVFLKRPKESFKDFYKDWKRAALQYATVYNGYERSEVEKMAPLYEAIETPFYYEGTSFFEIFISRDTERFSFYMLPKILVTEDLYKNLSSDAKILYACLLERSSLSFKNDWIDEQGRVYIVFTVEEIMKMLNKSNKTAVKILNELDANTKGIGLIERKRQGLGKPNIIYVKDFMSVFRPECKNYTSRSEEFTLRKCRYYTSRNIRRKISKNLKRVKKSQKKQKDKMMVGVVFGLDRLFFTAFVYKYSLILYNKSVNVGGDV